MPIEYLNTLKTYMYHIKLDSLKIPIPQGSVMQFSLLGSSGDHAAVMFSYNPVQPRLDFSGNNFSFISE